MAQVSLAWSLVRVTAPVIGSTSIKNLEDLISKCSCYVWGDGSNICFFADGTDVILTQEEIQYLEEPYKARSVMGHY